MTHKCLFVSVCLIMVGVVVAYSLIDFNTTDERNDIPGSQTQVEMVSPSEINRSPPSALRRKMLAVPALEQHAAPRVESKERMSFLLTEEKDIPEISLAELASEKNQVMDELLDRPQVPSDYGDVMIGLYRDKSQDVLTRAFAVQHIGLYARDLSRRGEYSPGSADARNCRKALFAAAAETRTVVAAAAFRALAEMAGFDAKLDARRLDSLLAACAADPASATAVRAMAVQLCGERRIVAARPALGGICADGSVPEILRRSARRALESIDGVEVSR